MLVLPDDPLPAADAVVSVGHVVNYVGDREAIIGRSSPSPGRCDPADSSPSTSATSNGPRSGKARPVPGKIGDDWAIAVEFSIPAPDRFVRDIATFLRNDDGTWRRSDERHENVLLDTKELPALLADLAST